MTASTHRPPGLRTPEKWRRRLLALVATLPLLVPGLPAQTAYPEKPITLIIPYAAGGSHDLNARALASNIQRYLGQPIVIKLVPGQATQKGVLEAISAPPDGYTLLFIDNYIDQLHQYTFRRRRYDTSTDLVTVARTNYGQTGVLVRGDSRYEDWSDVAGRARAAPGVLKASHSGLWGALFTPAAQIMIAEDIRFRMIPYRGGGPAKAALLAGDVDIALGFPATLGSDFESGRIRVLATAGEQRMLENVPSFDELGLPPTAGFMHRIIMAPTGTPPERLEILRTALSELQDDAAYLRLMERLGENTEYMDGREYEALRREQAREYRALVSALTGQ